MIYQFLVSIINRHLIDIEIFLIKIFQIGITFAYIAIMSEILFFLTRRFCLYTRKYSQKKPAFWHVLRSGNLTYMKDSAVDII